MRTYKLELGIDLEAVVPDSWVLHWRGEALKPDATEFLRHADQDNPDDEDFALHLLRHGVRRHVRAALQDLFLESGLGCTLSPALFLESGLGCTLSPARAKVIDRSPPVGVEPVLASEIV